MANHKSAIEKSLKKEAKPHRHKQKIMKLIVSATHREGSFSLKVSQIVKDIYQELGEVYEILDLRSIDFGQALSHPYPEKLPLKLNAVCDKIVKAEALVIVCPEYNGSFPGIFKHFLDHWHFPKSFTHKPVCLVGLSSGQFGALRAMEHLASVFLYRNSFFFPERVLISYVQKVLKDGRITDEFLLELMKKQALNFTKFVRALKTETFKP